DGADPVTCPFGWHDMTQESATVWTCEQDGATLVVGAPGAAAKVAPRVVRAPELVPQQTILRGRHRRP
ncbi:hypothetical protein, partial [Streptomyces noursei]|uniref:hypothetical protein n=2 Tax=Streptomyces noursei TaxID=1971 RepID=UPI0033F33F0F